jgi:hypothetical protein
VKNRRGPVHTLGGYPQAALVDSFIFHLTFDNVLCILRANRFHAWDKDNAATHRVATHSSQRHYSPAARSRE